MTRLPTWAASGIARALIAQLIEDRPARDRVMTETLDGKPADYGFSGRAAAQLRKLWEPHFMARLDWVGEATHGSTEYHRRRDKVLAEVASDGPDVLIQRVLDEAGALTEVEHLGEGRIAA